MKYKYWLDNTGLSNGKEPPVRILSDGGSKMERRKPIKIPQLKEEEIQRITKAKRKWDINEEYQKLEEGGVALRLHVTKIIRKS